MKIHDSYSAAFWFLIGVYFMWEGYDLRIGTLKEPSSGFLIFWAGAVLSFLSVITCIHALVSEESGYRKLWEGGGWRNSLLVLLSGFVYVLLFPLLGFLLSTFLFMLFLFKCSGLRTWFNVFAASFLSVSCSWLLFYVCLQVQFPQGLIERMVIRLLGLS